MCVAPVYLRINSHNHIPRRIRAKDLAQSWLSMTKSHVLNVANNLSTGKFCVANIGLAILGGTATLTMKDGAQIFAALATGCWFLTQSVLAIRNARRLRRIRFSK